MVRGHRPRTINTLRPRLCFHMDLAVLFARLLLAGVFTVAGLAKLIDPKGSREAMRDFGLPDWAANPVAIALPVAELAVATLLVKESLAWLAAVGALGLLLAFILGIAVNIAKGRRPKCRCFGQIRSRPVGWPAVARNAVLALAAGLVAGQGRDYKILLGVAGFFAVGAAVWPAVAKRASRLPATVAAYTGIPLPIGELAPDFRLSNLSGEMVGLSNLNQDGRSLILMFSDPDCEACEALLPKIAEWQREHARKLRIAILIGPGRKTDRSKIKQYELTDVLLQQEYEVAQAYQTEAGPSAVLVMSDGTIGSDIATGSEAIRALIADALQGNAG